MLQHHLRQLGDRQPAVVLKIETRRGFENLPEMLLTAMHAPMLNKGPHVVSAVRVLDNILRRMQMHQAKKSAMLRELRLAHLPGSNPLT